jgi:hypothetical protein
VRERQVQTFKDPMPELKATDDGVVLNWSLLPVEDGLFLIELNAEVCPETALAINQLLMDEVRRRRSSCA